MSGVCHDSRLCGGSMPCVSRSWIRTVSQHAPVGGVPEALACMWMGDRPLTFLSPPLAISLVQSSCSRITHMFIYAHMCVHTSTIHMPGSRTPLPQNKGSWARSPSTTCCTKMTSQPSASLSLSDAFLLPSIKGATPRRPSPPSLVLQTALGRPSYQDPHTAPVWSSPTTACVLVPPLPPPSQTGEPILET